jgi:hypothetical protein
MSEPTWELLGGGGVVGGPIDYVGDWAAGTAYQPGQVVRYQGVDYLAVNPSLGQVPPPTSPNPNPMVCLYDQVLAANAPNFDIQNISQIYKLLQVFAQVRSTDAAGQSSCFLRFNGDATNGNYYYEYLTNYASTVVPNEGLGGNQIFVGNCPAATAPAGATGFIDMKLPFYSETVFQKVMAFVGVNRNGIVSTTVRKDHGSGHWLSTAAINRLTLYPGVGQFLAGSRLTLYGLRGLS